LVQRYFAADPGRRRTNLPRISQDLSSIDTYADNNASLRSRGFGVSVAVMPEITNLPQEYI